MVDKLIKALWISDVTEKINRSRSIIKNLLLLEMYQLTALDREKNKTQPVTKVLLPDFVNQGDYANQGVFDKHKENGINIDGPYIQVLKSHSHYPFVNLSRIFTAQIINSYWQNIIDLENSVLENLIAKWEELEIAASQISELEALKSHCTRLTIKALIIGDKDYPLNLLDYPNPPLVFYYRGANCLKILQTRCKVGIVGTRQPTFYGEQITRKLVAFLAANNIPVISGLAYGIDALAHNSALLHKGETLAVLANGLDICYPKANQKIFNEIIECGGLLSEYPPGVKAKPYYFPYRNRLISGLSTAVIIPEAGLKSGSLVTADYAITQSKLVMVAPGSIFSSQSLGCNQLIKDGAELFLDIQNFHKRLQEELQLHSNQSAPEFSSATKGFASGISNYQALTADVAANLTAIEKEILLMLLTGTADFFAIQIALGLPINEVLSALGNLESRGLIKNDFGSYSPIL